MRDADRVALVKNRGVDAVLAKALLQVFLREELIDLWQPELFKVAKTCDDVQSVRVAI